MVAELEELRQRFASLRDEELLKIVTARRAQYRQVALTLAEDELTRRGVKFATTAGGPPAGAHAFSARPAPAPARGTSFWLGLLLIGCLCYWAAGMVDQLAQADPDVFESLYLLKPVLIILISLIGGHAMKWWESVD